MRSAQSRLASLRDSPALFCALLALPGAVMTYRYVEGATFYGEYLHATGELGARLLIAALAVTPLRSMFPAAGWTSWLARRRRYIGVAAFGYASLHAVAYVVRQPFATVTRDVAEIAMWTGWTALLVMLALAATSNDISVRLLRRRWKWLHRAAYAAAALTFAHWILSAFAPNSAALHLGVLATLEAIRVWKMRAARRPHAVLEDA
jgi:methionine sulfoxide reductase heme-binding subunit